MEAVSKNMSYFILSTIITSRHSMIGLLILKTLQEKKKRKEKQHRECVSPAEPECLQVPRPLSPHTAV